MHLPFVISKVQAGFPSPADDYLDNTLNLNDLLIKRPAATFLVRATGRSMEGLGIFSNDILVVDRSLKPMNGSIVVAAIDGDCLVKIYRQFEGNYILQSANPNFPDFHLNENTDIEIWGVVSGVVRQVTGDGRVCNY